MLLRRRQRLKPKLKLHKWESVPPGRRVEREMMCFGLDGPVVERNIFKQLESDDVHMNLEHRARIRRQLRRDGHRRGRVAGAALRSLAGAGWICGLHGILDGAIAEVFSAGVDDDDVVAAIGLGAVWAQAPGGQNS